MDVVELLRLIRGFCCDFGAGQQSTWALEQAKHKVSVYYQRHDTSNTDYIQFFQALVGVVETYGGAYGNEPGLIEAHLIGQGVAGGRLDAATSAQLAAAKADCREAYLACMLLRGADSIRYGTLKTELANDMTKGQDNYPKTMVEAARLLNDYRVATRFQRARDDPGEGMAFVQDRGGGRRTARLLIPVLGFLFHISEIQYFSGFLRFLRNSFFLHRNSSLFLFYFWSSKQ